MSDSQTFHLTFSDYLRSDWLQSPHITLWGQPIAHSLSPLIHNTAARIRGLDWHYLAVDTGAEHLNSIMAQMNKKNWLGGNITIPHKQLFFDVVDKRRSAAIEIGAINTVIKEKGQLIGDNTDWKGFLHPLDDEIDVLAEERAIVFGSGGAARAVVYALIKAGLRSIVLVSRHPERIRHQWDWDRGELVICDYSNWVAYAEEALLIVNCTPLGMEPYEDQSPVRETDIEILEGKLCYDIVYNPLQTLFLKQAEQAGADIINGLPMLVGQAAESFEMWTNTSFPEAEVMQTIQRELRT